MENWIIITMAAFIVVSVAIARYQRKQRGRGKDAGGDAALIAEHNSSDSDSGGGDGGDGGGGDGGGGD